MVDMGERTDLQETVKRIAERSTSEKKKVGCLIIKDGRIVSTGYNRVPSVMEDQACELNGQTRPEVIHAEVDALLNCNETNCTMIVSLAPCINCASLILHSGRISELVYLEPYKRDDGLRLLQKHGIRIVSSVRTSVFNTVLARK